MMAPSLVGSPRVQGHRDYVIKAMLHGLTGPLDGKTYTDVMVPMGTNQRRMDRGRRVLSSATASATPASFVTPATSRACARDRPIASAVDAAELEASLPVALAASSARGR